MVTAFENFTLYVAKDMTVPGTSNAAAASLLKISNDSHIKLIYCAPVSFAKRVTDNSNAQNIDRSSPDTGTASNQIELLIREDREDTGSDLLKKLMQMHWTKSDNDIFRFGVFGLLADDNPELNVKPTELGGYKWLGFWCQPNQDNPATQLFRIRLDYLGDHAILGAFL